MGHDKRRVRTAEELEYARELGGRLREIRAAVAGTQPAWTARTGMPQGYLSRLEHGEGWYAFLTVWAALRRAGVDVASLFVTAEEAEVLAAYRALPATHRASARAMLAGLAAAAIHAASPETAPGEAAAPPRARRA